MKGYLKRLSAVILSVAVLILVLVLSPLFPGPSVLAQEDSDRIVKVAYPVQEGLTDIDEKGNYCGYTYEYLQEIAQYTGWEYEFVQIEGSLDEQITILMDMLEKGEVDLMGGMLYSEAMGKMYNYSSQSYGTVETVLQTTYEHAGEITIDSNNEQSFRIAVSNLEGRSILELEDYCSMNMIAPEFVLCENDYEQVEAVREGRADLLLNTSMNPLEGVITIASFAPKPFYYICSKQLDGSLLNDLNSSIQYIAESNPFFTTNLFEKYFTSSITDFEFTDKELEYIESLDTLQVGVVENQPPYYFKTYQDVEAGGIMVDICKLLSDKSGLRLELVGASDLETLYRMLSDGEVDMIAGVPHNYQNAIDRTLVMTDPYLTEQYVLVMGNGTDKLQLKGKRLAMSQSSTYEGYTVGEAVYFKDMNECMKAIIDGKADYTYVDTCTAQYYANLPEYWNLRQTPVSYDPLNLCFGLAKPADRTLLVILNKVITSITVEEQQVIITDNVIPESRLSLNYIVREYPVQIFCVSISIFFVVLIWLLQGIRARRRFHEETEKRNQLYEMVNDHFFEYYHESDMITLSKPFNGDGNIGMVTGSLRESGLDEEICSGFIKTVRSGQDGDFEVYDKCQDGKSHWLRIIQKNLRNRNNVVYCTIGKVKIIDSEKDELMEFVNKAQRDGLTGLYNASTFRAMTEKILEEMEPGVHGALLLMDIDYFKRINDVYGHMQGDKALCWLAEVLRQYFEDNVVLSRYGGDEMMVFLSQVSDKEHLREICEGLCRLVRQNTAIEIGKLTISLGAVMCSSSDSYDDVFLTADFALYQTKSAGRDGFYIAENIEAAEEHKGRISCKITEKWLDDTSYQAILKATRMIAFEYDVEKKVQRVSPFIGEYIAGNYDGRLLSDVMVEDGVIYPDDVEKSLNFKKEAVEGNIGETVLRLMTPSGNYRWFRLILTNHKKPDGCQMTVGVIEDIHIQMQYQELLRHRAEIDSVSGIYNKDTFFEQTQKLLADESEVVHYLLRFDIERFKLINELSGSAEGDRVLKYVGDILRSKAIGGDTYGRLGNDVFGMCTGRSREETIVLVKQMGSELKKYPLSFKFFLPTGIIEIPPESGEQVSSLCDRAAMAQRRIKGNYLRGYSFYEPYMGQELNREYELVANMEEALDENQFVVYFQPQYDMRDESLVGVEALARWQHPTLGMISPNEFIPLFEKNGFIIRLDEYIWEQVCLTIRDWLDIGLTPVPVSVNVSRTHLYDSGFCDKVIDLCNRYDIPHSLLELEITESAYTDSPQDLFKIMDMLQQTGFIFAMDDFGSGYSSLNILKDIPVNIVKFDLRFLEKTRRGDEVGRNILKHTIRLMKDLNLSVLAEGVENEEQISFLLDMGCYYAQGFYYARPMPLADFRKLLEEREQ